MNLLSILILIKELVVYMERVLYSRRIESNKLLVHKEVKSKVHLDGQAQKAHIIKDTILIKKAHWIEL